MQYNVNSCTELVVIYRVEKIVTGSRVKMEKHKTLSQNKIEGYTVFLKEFMGKYIKCT